MNKVQNSRLRFSLFLTFVTAVITSTALAQTGSSNEATRVVCETDVVVQADDWLSKIAEKFFGDVLAFPAIFNATNNKFKEDKSYAFIEDPNLIEPGWKLCIPGVEVAERTLESDVQGLVPMPTHLEYNNVTFMWNWTGSDRITNEDWYFDIKIFVNSSEPYPYQVFVAEPLETRYIDGRWSFDGTAQFRCGSHWAVQIAKRNPDGSYAGSLSEESERLPIGPPCDNFFSSSPVTGD